MSTLSLYEKHSVGTFAVISVQYLLHLSYFSWMHLSQLLNAHIKSIFSIY